MGKRKLTATSVKTLKPGHQRVEIPDALVPGLYLIVQPSGRKSWAVRFRWYGKPAKHTLGQYPGLELADAREAAREALKLVAKDIDPRDVKREREEAATEARANTVAAVVDQYIERYAKRQTRERTWRETERVLRKEVVGKWGKRPIASITRRDVLALLDDIVDRGADHMANRTLAAIRHFFTWAVEREFVDASPALNVRAPAQVSGRDRVLSDDEIRAIWKGSAEINWPFRPMIRLLLATAQRRNEVARMRWEDLDLEAKVWTLPREATKSDRAHTVPLSPLALEILEEAPHFGSYVFASGRRGDRPPTGFSAAKTALCKTEATDGVADWRIHDLRRTATSGMARLNVPPHILSRVLNHADSGQGITAIYNRHHYEDEKRHALETWAAYLEDLTRPPRKKVVPMHGRAAL